MAFGQSGRVIGSKRQRAVQSDAFNPSRSVAGIGLRQFALGNGSIGRVNDAKVWVTYMHTQTAVGVSGKSVKNVKALVRSKCKLIS